MHAKTVLSATTTTNPNTEGPYVNDFCTLSDGAAVDGAQWNTSFSNESLIGVFLASGTVSADIAVSSATASTVTLTCYPVATSGAALATTRNTDSGHEPRRPAEQVLELGAQPGARFDAEGAAELHPATVGELDHDL